MSTRIIKFDRDTTAEYAASLCNEEKYKLRVRFTKLYAFNSLEWAEVHGLSVMSLDGEPFQFYFHLCYEDGDSDSIIFVENDDYGYHYELEVTDV